MLVLMIFLILFFLVSSWWQNSALYRWGKKKSKLLFSKKTPSLVHSFTDMCSVPSTCYVWSLCWKRKGEHGKQSQDSQCRLCGRQGGISVAATRICDIMTWKSEMKGWCTTISETAGIRLTWSEVWGIFLRMPQRLGETWVGLKPSGNGKAFSVRRHSMCKRPAHWEPQRAQGAGNWRTSGKCPGDARSCVFIPQTMGENGSVSEKGIAERLRESTLCLHIPDQR